MSILSGSSILVTGGTGSFGKAFITEVLKNHDPKRIVVFSRDELKQYECRQPVQRRPAAALVHRRHPRPAPPEPGDARGRLRGPRGRAEAGRHRGVQPVGVRADQRGRVAERHRGLHRPGRKKVAALDRQGVLPINLYGATKLTADKLFVTGNHYAAAYLTRFSVVRYGNVMGSRGSVIPFFRKLADAGQSLPITDLRMTRFFITLPQAVKFVTDSFEIMQGGELYVPRIPSMKIVDLAQAVAPGAEMHEIGLRPGEKLHEEMISPEEGRRALRIGDRYVLQPDLASWGYTAPEHGEPVPDGFHYTSDNNDEWFTREDFTKLIETDL